MNKYNNPLNEAIDHFLNHSLSDVFGVSLSSNRPSANIYEDNETHYLDLAVPGIAKDDLNMSIEQNKLIIKFESKISHEDESKEFVRKGFGYDSFERTFTIPETADIEKIKASYDEGILKISLAKKEEAVDKGPINIEIL